MPRKSRWAAWSLWGALLFGGATLLVPSSRADAPRHATKTAKKRERPARSGAARPSGARHHARAPRGARAKPRARRVSEEPGLDVAASPDEACHTQLRKSGVSFVKVARERAPNVLLPIRLTGDVAGVEIRGAGKDKVTHYLDCRLALALVRWAPQLKAAGVTRVDHYSIYRPEAEVAATRKPSGHALALAIDAARFHLRDGRVLTVLDTWLDKSKGADPCAPRPRQGNDERLLRDLACEASRSGIFQTVVTPHHDPSHDNHVHLEVSGAPAPTWIH